MPPGWYHSEVGVIDSRQNCRVFSAQLEQPLNAAPQWKLRIKANVSASSRIKKLSMNDQSRIWEDIFCEKCLLPPEMSNDQLGVNSPLTQRNHCLGRHTAARSP